VTATGWTTEVLFSAESDFLLCHPVQTGSGARPRSIYKMSSFLGGKAAGT
jgi:hypothetical protein